MALVAGLKRGDLIAGKYKVERVIGRGGMSVVLGALHIGLDEPVAIKLLLPEAIESDVVLMRFQREARAAAKIKSEHVTRVLDVGAIGDDTPYIVMERLDGEDLGARLKRDGPCDVATASRYVLQACEALAEAHSVGIVHRDLKPDNLFLTRRRGGSEVIKVLDFGISKAMAPEQAAMTRTSTIIGSPLYMSPEQLRTPKEVDHRTDIWTLGVVLYELTTGRPPFAAKNLRELAFAIVGDPPTPMARVVAGIAPEFEAVVRRCLSKERGPRYQTIVELARALAPFSPVQGGITVERTAALMPVAPSAIAAEQTQTGTVRLRSEEDAAQTAPTPAEPLPAAAVSSAPVATGPVHTVPVSAVSILTPPVRSLPRPSQPPAQPVLPPAPSAGSIATTKTFEMEDEDSDDRAQTVLIDLRRSDPSPPSHEDAVPAASTALAAVAAPAAEVATSNDVSAATSNGVSPWKTAGDELTEPAVVATRRSRSGIWLIAALGLLLVGGAIAYLTLRASPGAAPADGTAPVEASP